MFVAKKWIRSPPQHTVYTEETSTIRWVLGHFFPSLLSLSLLLKTRWNSYTYSHRSWNSGRTLDDHENYLNCNLYRSKPTRKLYVVYFYPKTPWGYHHNALLLLMLVHLFSSSLIIRLLVSHWWRNFTRRFIRAEIRVKNRLNRHLSCHLENGFNSPANKTGTAEFRISIKKMKKKKCKNKKYKNQRTTLELGPFDNDWISFTKWVIPYT